MKELYSTCCNANMQGESTNNLTGVLEGRCADCAEMAGFIGNIEVNYIEQVNYLGSTDGQLYTIVPVR